MASILTVAKLVKEALIGSKAARQGKQGIDFSPQYVPIDSALLKVTIGKYLKGNNAESAYRDINAALLGKYNHRFHVVNGLFYNKSLEITANNIYLYTPAIVLEGNNVIGILFADNSHNNYVKLQREFFREIVNPQLKKYVAKGTTFDPGHTLLSIDSTVVGMTPSGSQVINLLNNLATVKDSGAFSDEQNALLGSTYSKIQDIASNFRVHLTYTTSVEISIKKVFGALNSISANVLIIQESQENRQEFGQLEKRLIEIVSKEAATLNFSRNLYEEIEYKLVETLKGRKVSSTTKLVKIKEKVKGTTTKVKVSAPVKPPATRNVQGQFYSLASLQMLINTHLQDVVSANMGDEGYPGGQRRILNYRTGRFASSVKVERLTQSREGAISAFYSYMKYPYQTFEPGFKMGSPKTRDPKLLISKSIREIAATKVGNRLRAVLI